MKNRTGLQLIYEPKGAAKEYAKLACNLFTGCKYGCTYCYAPATLRKTREEFEHVQVKPALFEKLEHDLAILDTWNPPVPPVLLSFTHDPFQPLPGFLDLTLEVIRTMKRHRRALNLLTKAGGMALEALSLLDNLDWVGTSMAYTSDDSPVHAKYEPKTQPVVGRQIFLKTAHDRGLRTWVSLEPILDAQEAVHVVEWCIDQGCVDLVAIGKLNHHPDAKAIDWVPLREKLEKMLYKAGVTYLVKESLRCL